MRIVAWDLECSSLSGMVGRVLCCGFKEIVHPEVRRLKPYVFRGDDEPYFSKDIADDGKLVAAIRDELEKYDVLVVHNGKPQDSRFGHRAPLASERSGRAVNGHPVKAAHDQFARLDEGLAFLGSGAFRNG